MVLVLGVSEVVPGGGGIFELLWIIEGDSVSGSEAEPEFVGALEVWRYFAGENMGVDGLEEV